VAENTDISDIEAGWSQSMGIEKGVLRNGSMVLEDVLFGWVEVALLG
jgi:hypothetical protein